MQQHKGSGRKFTCSQIQHFVLESQIQIHPTIGKRSWRIFERTWICRELKFGRPRSAIHLARTTKCFQPLTSRSIFSITSTGKIQNLWMKGSCSCIWSTTYNGQRKASPKKCLQNAREVAAYATKFKSGHWCFLRGPRPKVRGGTQIFTNAKDNGTLSHCRRLTHPSVALSTRYFLQQSQYRLDS